MKKLTLIFVALIVLMTACNNYFVPQRDPAVLDSSIELSGEVTGDIYPEVRTLSMRASGQAGNFLLLEIYGMESFCNTQSVDVLDSLAGTELFLEIVDDGTPGTERCYRNLRFHIGPFEKEENYVLHLAENAEAFSQDVLSVSFNYSQSIDSTVLADSYYYLLSDMPFQQITARSYEGYDVPEFNYDEFGYYDTLRFFETDSGLLIRTLLNKNDDVTHSVDYSIVDDSLIMLITLGPASNNMASKSIFFDYLIEDYAQQYFFYQFYLTNSNWAMFEGFYTIEN